MTSTALAFDILARDKASADLNKVGDSAERTGHKVGGLSSKFAGLGKAVALGAAAAGAGAFALGKGFYDAAIESQKITKQTEAVIKSMGGAAKVTAKQVGDLAGALAMKTGVDDELIQSGQNVLLTFANIRNEAGKGPKTFDRATKAALDMSVALGTDMTSASMMLGKALNDPTDGLSKLARSGIQFTDQQKEQIKVMQEAGNVAGAQAIMLSELERQFGGSAEAQATAGDRLKVVWGNLQETLGNGLVPIVERAASWLTTALPAAMDTAGGAFESAKPYLDTARDAFAAIVREGLDALSGWWDRNGDNVTTWFSNVGTILRDDVAPALQSVGGFIKDDVYPGLRDLGAWIVDNEAVFETLKLGVLGIAGAWATYTVAAAAAAAATAIVSAPLVVGTVIVLALASATNYLADRFSTGLSKAFQKVVDVGAGVLDFFRDVAHWIGEAVGAAKRLIDLLPKIKMPGGGGGSVIPSLPGPFDEILRIGGLARGTDSWRGGPTWVGEEGPEILNLPRGSQVIPHRESMALAGASMTNEFTIVAPDVENGMAAASRHLRRLAVELG